MELLNRAPADSAAAPDPPGVAADVPGPSLQERLETSQFGRRLLSVLLVAVVAAAVLWNLPESAVREQTAPVVEQIVNTVGLDQRWNLFAPNPPRRTFEVVARIEYTDGSLVLWRSPRNDRWRKWLGTIRSERSRRLWEPTAAWIATHHDSAGRQTRRVELIVRWRDLPAPGSGLPEFSWQEDLFFTYDVPTAEER
ncbi:MAG: hypothetical protein M3507_04105 [Actinomycetota bacterium]|jgi:hypothetical protein|nr:hypothetical protein [Actinomycetota bacterium]